MLTVIGAMIRIPLPFSPVPFTLQTVFVVLSGFILGKYDGAFSQLAYMIIGLIGVPIFTGGGGIGYVLTPSFGYIIGFVVGAYVAGFCFNRCKTVSVIKIFLCGVLGLLAIYIIGMFYQIIILVLVNDLSFISALSSLVIIIYMFIGDGIILFVICLFYPRLMSMMKLRDESAGAETAATKDIASVKKASKNKYKASKDNL